MLVKGNIAPRISSNSEGLLSCGCSELFVMEVYEVHLYLTTEAMKKRIVNEVVHSSLLSHGGKVVFYPTACRSGPSQRSSASHPYQGRYSTGLSNCSLKRNRRKPDQNPSFAAVLLTDPPWHAVSINAREYDSYVIDYSDRGYISSTQVAARSISVSAQCGIKRT